jgi:amidohydrolase
MGACEGTMMASMDSFTIKLKGKGAHAAQADLGVDAIVMSSEVISTLQTLISREVSPTTPIVLHIGSIHGGTAFNVVAENVELQGTVRIFDEELRASMPDRMDRIIGGVASAMRGSHQLDYQFGYPVLINDEIMTRMVKDSIIEIVGREGYMNIQPRMASEDMAFFHQKVPGCFFYLGAANAEKGLSMPNHNPRFDFDEDALVLGTQAMTRVAWNFLSSNREI